MLGTLALCAYQSRFNDVQDYLKALSWDGTPRLDTLIVDYLGAEDTAYARQVARKSLAATVAPVMMPGTKYDYMPILAGPQGIGKSTLLRLLGLRWYSDSLETFEGWKRGKTSRVAGYWSLASWPAFCVRKAMWSNSFCLSRRIFTGSPTGGAQTFTRAAVCFSGLPMTRSFCGIIRASGVYGRWMSVADCRQKRLYAAGGRGSPYLGGGLRALAVGRSPVFEDKALEIWNAEVKRHKVSNVKEGLIRDFLEKPVPPDWDKHTQPQRRIYWSGSFVYDREGAQPPVPRDRICAAELWNECFGKDVGLMRQTDTREINGILDSLEGWERFPTSARFGPYGLQRGYKRLSTR